MKKTAVLLTMAMCMMLVTPAFAVEQYSESREEQIRSIMDSVDMESLYEEAKENMEQGINDNPYENISISCEATCEDTITRSTPEIETEYGYTVRELGTIYDQYTGEETGTLYTVAAVSENRKTSSNENTEDCIITKLYLTWIDNLGTDNELVGTHGSWEYESTKEVEDKMVVFGSYLPALGFDDCITRYPSVSKMEFNYGATRSITGLKFASEASLHSVGYGTVSLRVVSSVYD